MIQCDVIQEGVSKIGYPWIGVSNKGAIVLFTSVKTGTLLFPGIAWKKEDVGTYISSWDMDMFSPLKGTVTISNAA
jgi:hypothetical protein